MFAYRNFRLVYFGALVSDLGTVLYSFAVSFYILEISGNNAFLQGVYLALCGAVLLVFTPLGHTANNATRWIMVGPITIMPGEISKMGMIFFIAWFCAENTRKIRSFTRGMLPILVVAGVFAAMIIKQPNLSTAITLVGIVLVMMLVLSPLLTLVVLLAKAFSMLPVVSMTSSLAERLSRWLTRIASAVAGTIGEPYSSSP